MKNLLLAFLLMPLIFMTKAKNNYQQPSTISSFKILSEKPNVNIKKCNIEIRLGKKISKEELTKIANKLRETRKSYNNLWIFYYLPGMKVGSWAWATTHFTPNLKVEIL